VIKIPKTGTGNVSLRYRLECCICGKNFIVPSVKREDIDNFYWWAWACKNDMICYFPCPKCKEEYCGPCIENIENDIAECHNCVYKKERESSI